MTTRLFVGNLSYDTTEESLGEAFGADGRNVRRVTILLDRDTGRPRGFGFVDMETEDDARAAIEAMDGFELDGRALRVDQAKERQPGGDRGARPDRRGGPPPARGGGGREERAPRGDDRGPREERGPRDDRSRGAPPRERGRSFRRPDSAPKGGGWDDPTPPSSGGGKRSKKGRGKRGGDDGPFGAWDGNFDFLSDDFDDL